MTDQLDLGLEATSGAVLSDDRRYRYRLWRHWGDGPRMAWVMLNPSTADHQVDDQTIRKCKGFARAHGCAGITVVNLFALRSRNPDELLKNLDDAVGELNDDHIRAVVDAADIVVGGWGAHKAAEHRAAAVYELVNPITPIFCLGTNDNGSPKHPCYLDYETPLVGWKP